MSEFWEYFVGNEYRYQEYINLRLKGDTDKTSEMFIKSELLTEITKVHKGLWVNLGKYVQGDYVMMPCFNPWEGEPSEEAVKAIYVILETAPKIERWEIRRVQPTDMVII